LLIDEFLGVRYAELLQGLPLPALRRIIRFGAVATSEQSWEKFLSEATDASRALSPAAVADIMFTSGTTGEPKGAIATHAQAVATARLWARATTLAAGDRFLRGRPFPTAPLGRVTQ